MTYYIFETYFLINAFLTFARFNPRDLVLFLTLNCGAILTGDAFDVCVRTLQYIVASILLGSSVGMFFRTSSRDLKYASLTIALLIEIRFFWKGIWPYISGTNLFVLLLCFFGDQFDKGLRILFKMLRELLENASVNEQKEIHLDNSQKDKGLLTPGKCIRKAMDLEDKDNVNDTEYNQEEGNEQNILRNPSKKNRKVK